MSRPVKESVFPEPQAQPVVLTSIHEQFYFEKLSSYDSPAFHERRG